MFHLFEQYEQYGQLHDVKPIFLCLPVEMVQGSTYSGEPETERYSRSLHCDYTFLTARRSTFFPFYVPPEDECRCVFRYLMSF
jgi:hypothetical protein